MLYFLTFWQILCLGFLVHKQWETVSTSKLNEMEGFCTNQWRTANSINLNERKEILKKKDRVSFFKKCFVNSTIMLNILMMISITNMDKTFEHIESLSKFLAQLFISIIIIIDTFVCSSWLRRILVYWLTDKTYQNGYMYRLNLFIYLLHLINPDEQNKLHIHHQTVLPVY